MHPTIRGDGYVLAPAAFDDAEVAELRSGLEAAVERAVALAGVVTGATRSDLGHRIQTVRDGGTPTSVHWEPDTETPTVRNLRPVTHLDARLERYRTDPRLTGPAAALLGVDDVAPLTSKISVKRARVGSEYIWHQDHSFLSRFLGHRAASEVVTAMVFLDDADPGNGALSLVPGSHRDGPRPDDEPPRAHDADPVTVTAPAGSVVVFPTLMLHSSPANRSNRDRRALLYLFQPAGRPPLDESTRGRASGGTGPRVTACRGCCCGTARKHPGVDHDRLLDRLVDEVGDRGLVRTTDCLGPCAESNVVIVTPSPDARRRGARPVWVRAVLDDVTVRGIGAWVRDGGPGAAEMPLELAGRVFPRPGG